jgi:translin
LGIEGLAEDLVKQLEALYTAREWLIKRSRDVLTLCRKAIAKCMRRDASSDEGVNELVKVFEEYREFAKAHPELYYSNFYHSIESEFVEAVEFCYVIKEGRLLPYKSLGVSPVSFILGLLDVIGELKRYSLGLVERGRYEESLKVFEIAENVFNQLEELAFADSVVPGLKRKLDIYRKVLDSWRELLIDVVSREKLRKVVEEAKQCIQANRF